VRAAGTGGSFEGRTGGDGRFRIAVPPGRYRLLAGELRPTDYSRQDAGGFELRAGQCAQFQLAAAPPE
jgi:hypothetical protein